MFRRNPYSRAPINSNRFFDTQASSRHLSVSPSPLLPAIQSRWPACERFEVPLQSEPPPSSENIHEPVPENEAYQCVGVTSFRSLHQSCRFRVAVEKGGIVKQLAMPSTYRVDLVQRFPAFAGDQLTLEYVVQLRRANASILGHCSAGIFLVGVDSFDCTPLLDLSAGGEAAESNNIASTCRESTFATIPESGDYALKCIVEVDDHNPGALARLLIDSVTITNAEKTDARHLASLSCWAINGG